MELSLDEDKSMRPFAFISTDVTSPKCEDSVLMHNPELMSQNLIVLSFDLSIDECVMIITSQLQSEILEW